jgi:hypothetical protein
VLGIRVLTTVEFDNQILLDARKVDDVWRYWMLSSEFVSTQLPISQAHPEMTLRVGLIFAKLVSEWRGFHEPSPWPSPYA